MSINILKSTLYNIPLSFPDSLSYAGKFLQKHPVTVHPVALGATQGYPVFYLLFGLLSILAFIRFFYPATFQTLFSSFWDIGSRRETDHNSRPGWAVSLFLSFNFLVSVTLLVLVYLIKRGNLPVNDFTQARLGGMLAAIILFYYLFHQFITFMAGFLFNTKSQAVLQIKNNARWSYITGILLTPLLLVYFYSGSPLIIDIMVVILAVLLLVKWVQTARIGRTSRNIHLLHLFLYLCAVEIVPLLLLIKWGIQ